MKEQTTPSDNLGELRRQARLNVLRLKIAQQNEALAALRRSGFRDSLEGYDDPSNYFDPRDYLFEVPRLFGGAIPTTRNDRDEGRDFPIFRTEQELAVIRGAARLLTSTSPIAVGVLTTLTNDVIGSGFHYAVAPSAGSDRHFSTVANRVIDEFLEENGWIGDLDRELFQRSRVDGEYFLGLWHVGNGHVQARAVEPDQVTEPSNKSGIDKWLGFGPSPASSWTFGVHTDDTDAQAIHGFYVQWTNRDTEWDYFPGGNEPITPPKGAGLWMEHAKLNVVRSVKRGLSDFFPIQGNLDLARRVLRNMGEGSAVQAAIAWIQETAPGTTQAQTSSATLARADVRYTTNSAQGSRTHTAQHFDPATILKVPNGQRYLPGPLGAQNAPSFITAAEALLRTVAVRWSLPENLVTGTAEHNNFASSLVAESPFVKFAESQQQLYVRRDQRTLKRVLWFAWSAGRFGDVPWSLVEQSIEITVTPPQIEVRDPEKETRVREMLNKAGILSRKTWSAQEGLDFDTEQKNLAAEAQAGPRGDLNNSNKAAKPSLAESLEGKAFDPLKHPRGGNPNNRGEFSDAAGPTGDASGLIKLAAALKGLNRTKNSDDASRGKIQAYRPNVDGPPEAKPIPVYRAGQPVAAKPLATGGEAAPASKTSAAPIAAVERKPANSNAADDAKTPYQKEFDKDHDLTLTDACKDGTLSAGEILRIKFAADEIKAILKSADKPGSGLILTFYTASNLPPALRAQAERDFADLPGDEKYAMQAMISNQRRAAAILLFRNKAFQQYVGELYGFLRDLNPAHFLVEKGTVVVTGKDPMLGGEASRLNALKDMLIYIALMKGASWAGNKITHIALGPESASDITITFQSGGKLTIKPGAEYTRETMAEAIERSAAGEKISIEPPVKKPPRPSLTEVPRITDDPRAFRRWFNELTPEEFKSVWSNPRLRKVVEDGLRWPKGKHEWLMIARAPKFKEWGITAEQIAEMTTPTSKVRFNTTTLGLSPTATWELADFDSHGS